MQELIINPYFRDLIPPLAADEYAQLEENILAQGCRDAIKHWKGFIVDGHNRYEICRKHNLRYSVKKLGFSTKEDAIIWIVDNQLGRRNITDATKIRLALEKASLLKKRARQNRGKAGCERVHVHKTAAKDAGVGLNTLYKYIKIQEIGTPKLLQQLEAGEIKIGKAYKDLRSAKLSDYKLVVATKTVEELYRDDIRKDLTSPNVAAGFEGNLYRLWQLYCFITEKADMVSPGDDLSVIKQRLGRQYKLVTWMLRDG